MDSFELGRLLHSSAGSIALVSFWVAALAAKGGDLHRRAGKIYLLALIGVMTLSTLMVAGRALRGDPGAAIFLVFLISIVGTATWLTWFSIRFKHQEGRLHGLVYRSLASWLIIAGAGLFALGISRREPLMMLLSCLGLGFGLNMWRLALSRVRDRRWWVGQHMNGAMMNFIATHDSFIALGIGTVLPELRQPVPRMLIAAGVITTGLVLRALASRKFLIARSRPTHELRELDEIAAGVVQHRDF
jgi:hypothetical protein